MDPFQGDDFAAEFSAAIHDDESLNQLVSNSSSYCCDHFSSSCLDQHSQHQHQHQQHHCHSFSLAAASATCDLVSDTDSFGIKGHSPGGSASENLSILSSTSCGCFFGSSAAAAATDSSSSCSIAEQAVSFPAMEMSDHHHFPLLDSWHLVQYESLPGLLHVPEPLDHCKLSSSSPPDEHSTGGCGGGGGGLELMSAAAEDMSMDHPHVGGDFQDLFRGGGELPGSDSIAVMEISLDHPVAAAALSLPVAVTPVASSSSQQQHHQSSSSGSSNKRQRGCFTLQNVSESLQHHSIVFASGGGGAATALSDAMLLHINKNSSSSNTNAISPTNPTGSSSSSGSGSGSGGSSSSGSHGSFSYRLKETVEPQSIAARQRRKKISERVRELEKLVPGGNKLDTASMLDEAIRFVKFLQIQVQLLEAVGTGPVANYGSNHCLNVPLNHSSSATSTTAATATAASRLPFPFSSNCPSTPKNSAGLVSSCSSAATSVLLLGRRGSSSLSFSTSSVSGSSSSSPLVLTETLQHALFKHKRCVATIQQCPVEHLLL